METIEETATEVIEETPQVNRLPAMSPVTPMAMLSQLIEKKADPATLMAFLDLQDKWETRERRKQFDDAMVKAKAEMPPIKKTKKVTYPSKREEGGATSYKHGELGLIVEKVAPVLAKFGLGHRWDAENGINAPVTVSCIIFGYGHELRGKPLTGPPDSSGSKNTIQGVGSTLTYFKRYTLELALGLATSDDDDGMAAVSNGDAISGEQLEEIQKRVMATKSNINLFCKTFKIESLPDLPASRYAEAIGLLDKKAKLQGAAA